MQIKSNSHNINYRKKNVLATNLEVLGNILKELSPSKVMFEIKGVGKVRQETPGGDCTG